MTIHLTVAIMQELGQWYENLLIDKADHLRYNNNAFQLFELLELLNILKRDDDL